MENGPCYNCLTLLNFLVQPDHTFYIDVQFEHPFPGLDNFTGFDVRGVAIFDGSYVFPTSELRMSDRSLGDLELLNPDGYTTLFNPVDFPQGSGLPVFTYNKGKRATPLTNPATLNGFKAFYPNEPRRIFRAGASDTQTYHIAWPAGSKIRVGYVVDASWEPPLVKPVKDPLTDFGPNANCYEAYQISATIGSGLMPGCGIAPYEIDVWDHQGHDSVATATLEAPDLFAGIIADPSGIDMSGFTRFSGILPNEKGAGTGTYRVLIGVIDSTPDPVLGPILAYNLTTVAVEWAPIDYDDGWRKHGKTLDNSSYNPHETTIQPNLSEAWTHQLPTGSPSHYDGTPTVGPDGVYVVADVPYNQTIWALSLDDGETVWYKLIKFTPDNAIYRSTPTVGNCEVYSGGSSVFVMSSQDGDNVWSKDAGNTQFIEGSPVVVDGILVIWGFNNTLYAFDAITGALKWDYTTGQDTGSPSTPVVQDGVVYGGDINGYAIAVNLVDGSEIWKVQFPLEGPIGMREIMAQPVYAGGHVWVGSWNCHLYGLDPANGNIDHDIPLGDQLPWAGPSFDGNHLYQPTAYYFPYAGQFTPPYHVYAFNLDGSTAWTYTGTGNEAFFSTPAVANNVVWVPSDAGNLYMLDPATGDYTGQGTYALDKPVTSGVSIQDGRLYLMDTGGKVYCLK
jgi:outer membrane protein assembly factor BamB